MLRLFIFFAFISLLSSCNQNLVFSEYKTVDNNKWHKDISVNFNVEVKDTLSNNAIYINLRNDKDYDFNNIFLIVGVDYPNKTKVIDTLEYKMTDDKGYYLGTGFTDIKENKLEFKENIIFPTKGTYKFSIQHAMRKIGKENGVDYLEGVTDVGIEIEKVK